MTRYEEVLKLLETLSLEELRRIRRKVDGLIKEKREKLIEERETLTRQLQDEFGIDYLKAVKIARELCPVRGGNGGGKGHECSLRFNGEEKVFKSYSEAAREIEKMFADKYDWCRLPDAPFKPKNWVMSRIKRLQGVGEEIALGKGWG